MVVRYIIRPPGIWTTPRNLRKALNAKGTAQPSRGVKTVFDYNLDFFLCYNNNNNAKNVPFELINFAQSSKAGQRYLLAQENLPIPKTQSKLSFEGLNEDFPEHDDSLTYIVRPLRHSQGKNYKITKNPHDWNPNREYIQVMFPKAYEYRIITCFGTPIITLVKQIPEDLDNTQPWNHSNGSTFVTVNNPELNRLRHTDVYERLKANSIIKAAHLVGVDVLLNKKQDSYVICEFNFCPSITIPSNLDKVSQHVHSVRGA